jgi:hypothetical protein
VCGEAAVPLVEFFAQAMGGGDTIPLGYWFDRVDFLGDLADDLSDSALPSTTTFV